MLTNTFTTIEGKPCAVALVSLELEGKGVGMRAIQMKRKQKIGEWAAESLPCRKHSETIYTDLQDRLYT